MKGKDMAVEDKREKCVKKLKSFEGKSGEK
jgi:hypothetical protein